MIGKTFYRLTVVDYFGQDSRKNHLWKCICSCGGECVVRGSHLRRGEKRSCGCYRKENGKSVVKFAHIANTKHGLSRQKRLYNIWAAMLDRCSNPKHSHYDRYGGRGIAVCQEWLDPVEFFRWAKSSGYKRTLTLDRIDNDGGYHPGNCKWSTCKEQCRNKSNNLMLDFEGEMQPAVVVAEKMNLNYRTLLS